MVLNIDQNNLITSSSFTSQQTGEAEKNPSQPGQKTELSEEDQKKVDELKSREQEVTAHEQAHRMVGGSLIRGAIEYEYETGPDGNRYIVGGEVNIDTSPVSEDPEATIAKMQLVIRAALAPANPSAQDRRVAQEARSQEAKARMELMQQKFSDEETANKFLESQRTAPGQYKQNGEKADSRIAENRVNIWG